MYDAAEGPDISPTVDSLFSLFGECLRRLVIEERSFFAHALDRAVLDAEITQFHFACPTEQHIIRLQSQMEHVALVGVLQPIQTLDQYGEDKIGGHLLVVLLSHENLARQVAVRAVLGNG